MSKLDDIKNIAKEKAAVVADKAKNYDYKGKAEELKEKAADLAEQAKNYDYRAKAEEIKETVANYDYKEKVKEVTEAVKNFDYEEKAKEITEDVKNFDYKGEAENIKKGGLKYFWSKHKKLSIAIIIILVVGVVALSNSNNTDTANVTQNEVATNSQDSEKSRKKYIKNDDKAIEIATYCSYKGVGGKDPQFVSADIIERNKKNEYLVEVIWKEDTSYRHTTNFVVYIRLNEKLSDDKWDYNWNYLFSQSENYLNDLVPKLKETVEWTN